MDGVEDEGVHTYIQIYIQIYIQAGIGHLSS